MERSQVTQATRAATTAGAGDGSAPRRIRGNPWWTLASVALGVIMVGLDGTVVAIANPYIGRDLHASLADLQWVTNAYLLVLAVALIFGGKLGDRFGRRLFFLVGVVGFALSSLAVGLSGSIEQVIAFRALQGLFGALLMPNTLALLRSAFPIEKLNAAIGIWGGSSAVAIAAGPIIGGLLVEHVSWQSVFFVNLPVGAIALGVGLVALAESRDERPGQRFDVAGLLALAGGLFALVFAVVEAQSWSWGSARIIGLLVASGVLLAAFALIETRVAEPLLPVGIFRDRSVSLGTVLVILNFFALFGVLFFVTLYLQNVHGYSAVQAGVRTLPLTALFAFSAPLGGYLTQRFGPRLPLSVGMFAIAAALVGLTTLQVDSAYIHLWPPFVGLGVGMGFVITASTDAIVGNAPVEMAGVAGGLQSTGMQLGGAVGTAVLGSVLANRVAAVLPAHLMAIGAPAAQARAAAPLMREAVAAGYTPAPSGASAQVVHALTVASHASFMSGLHLAMIVAAACAAVGGVLGLLVRRGREGAAGPLAS